MNKIYLVQHCQSEHHINELTGGWTDTPLTELGKKQAVAVVNELKALKVNDFYLFSSDLRRAKMTAEFICKEFNQKIELYDTLREVNNGVAVNKTKEWSNNNKLFESNTIVVDKPLWQNAETPRELHNRMSKFIDDHLMNITNEIVLVSHGVAIGYLISSWLGISPEMMSNVFIKGNAGGISCITRNDLGQNLLTMFNSTSHLKNL